MFDEVYFQLKKDLENAIRLEGLSYFSKYAMEQILSKAERNEQAVLDSMQEAQEEKEYGTSRD
jgi:hypothetical protein